MFTPLYRASQGLSDGEIRMSLSSFVRVWQPLKEERCSLRISDFHFAVAVAKQAKRNLSIDFHAKATARGLV